MSQLCAESFTLFASQANVDAVYDALVAEEDAGAARLFGWQHRLSMDRAAAMVPALQAAATAEPGAGQASVAHFRSRALYGASAYLRCLTLSGSDFCGVLRRTLRLPVPGLGDGTRRCPWPGCSAGLDVFGDHADACPALAGRRAAGHDLVRDAVEGVLRQAGFRPHHEPVGLVPGTAQRPADVFISGAQDHGLGRTPQQRDLDCCIDVVGVHSLCPSYIGSADLQRPLVAAKAEKERRPGLPPEIFVVGFAFSSLGFLEPLAGRAVLGACDACWCRRRAAQDVTLDEGGALAVESRWLPQLSAAAHRGTWRAVQALVQGPAPGGGGGAGEALVPSALVYLQDGSVPHRRGGGGGGRAAAEG